MSGSLSVFSNLDWVVFGACMAITLAFVVYGNLKKKIAQSDADYILMGRQLTLPIFVATLVATWYGGIFGVTEIAFEQGLLTFMTQSLFWYVAYILFAFLLAKKIRRSAAITLPELVQQIFGPKAGKVAAVFNIFNVVPIAYAISLGHLVHVVAGIEMWQGMFLGTFFVLGYSLFGGFRAVIYSDLAQFFIMCSSVFFLLFFAHHQYGGLDFLQENLPAESFSLWGDGSWHTLSQIVVWGFIALSTLVDPNFYQRCFAADSEKTAKVGILASVGIWFLFDCCTIFGSMYAAAAMPDLNPESAYLEFALKTLPAGFRGFFIAGVLATIFSTIDSYVFIASNTISYDLFGSYFKNSLSRRWLDRLSIVLVGLLACFLAMAFQGSVKAVWKTFGSLSAGCLLVPVVWQLLKPGYLSERSFLISVFLSGFAIAYWRNLAPEVWTNIIDDLYVGIFLSVLSLVVGSVCEKRKFA